ncbi:helix-turn-helix domain-containing protein [Lentisphaerota bacterium]|nr:helix-turn-helix domain-containing protein [Lentisphaerota bacterium]
MSEFLTTKKVANLLAISVETIKRFRATNEGPKYAKFGKSIRYAKKDVDTWIELQKVKTT